MSLSCITQNLFVRNILANWIHFILNEIKSFFWNFYHIIMLKKVTNNQCINWWQKRLFSHEMNEQSFSQKENAFICDWLALYQ